MGEQSLQQETGLVCETQSDSTANSSEPIGAEHKQDLPVTEELIWKRASLDSPLMKELESVTGMLGHIVGTYAKSLNKQLKHLKRF
jgi:hypothetical protein